MTKKKGESEDAKKDRLNELLKKTEAYTKFILQQNIRHYQQHQKNQLA
jgi:predicted transcriptional regulator